MNRRINLCILTVVMAIVGLVSDVAFAAPIHGKVFNLRQPDGSKVQAKVWGDEFYQRVESIDGYTLIRDENGWICYAKLSADESEFVPTDAVYGGEDLDKHPKAQKIKASSGFRKKLELKSSARHAKSKANREKLGYNKLIAISPAAGAAEGGGIQTGPISPAPLLGSVVGLTICVQFPDETGTITTTQVDNYCNQAGYAGFGNNGSIYDYYFDVSGGNLQYTNIVVGYYTAQNNKGYYDDPARDAGDAGRELLGEALGWLESQNFDFTQLSTDASTILAINLFYAGQVESGWAMGLWPHSGYYNGFTSSSGVSSGPYQITDMGNSLEIGTFCHENGHMICQWRDLYDYGYESAGVGNFCLMAWGGPDGSNPIPPNAYYRDLKSWDTVTEIDMGALYSVPANSNISFKYPNPSNALESFYVESRIKTGRNASLPDEGLVIWHVDEAVINNNNEQMTPQLHYMVSLEQADGAFNLENNVNGGDSTDLFDASYKDTFDDTTIPNAKWWDGSDSGLLVDNISGVGSIMYFGADRTSPTPNPAEWEIEPQATGLHTIAMEAKAATDSSGVEYYFECVNDANKNSGWQDSELYERGSFNENTPYTFRVRYRDKSQNQNETGWSVEKSTATASGSDTLPPFPSPSRWKIRPKALRLQPTPQVRMSATATDETGPIEYYFTCTNINPPGPPPSSFDSGWRSSSIYPISSGLTIGSTYTFTVKARDGMLNETIVSSQASVTLSVQGSNVLTVPIPYATIQAAINAAVNGDIVEVRPGTYQGFDNRDLDFLKKAITVRSIDPNDPAVVAGTIIDCGGSSHRAFDFHRGEEANSVLAGFTIQNGYIRNGGADGLLIGSNGSNGATSFGGAINCSNNSKPTIRNCTIVNCVADGSGGNGAPGNPAADGNVIPGGNGGDNAKASGGAIYCDATSDPNIQNCTISNCRVISNGGNGGDGDPNTDPPLGIGGNGGNAFNNVYGGGIYCATGSNAIISNCTITNCNAVLPAAGSGGRGAISNGADGLDGGQAFGGGICLDAGYVDILSGTKVTFNTAGSDGGGIYLGLNNTATLINCDISSNTTGNSITGGNGGGIYSGRANPITLISCSISNNDCVSGIGVSGRGGGIWYSSGGTLKLSNCTVSNNIVSGDEDDGGGIYVGALSPNPTTTVIIDSNSTVSGNTAGYGGGGLFLIRTNLTVDDSTISDNNAVEGAGIWAYNSTANVSDCNVRSNSAALLGGGFAFIGGLADINNSVMTGNSASGLVGSTGGALFFEGWSVNPHHVTNCLITDNNASSDGGGLSNNIGSWVKVTNCTFARNEVTGSNGVGGGISCAEYWAYVEIFNSILWDNKATDGGFQIAVGDPDGSQPYGSGPYADVDVSYSVVQNGEQGVWLEDETQTYTALWWLDGNKDADPLFANIDVNEPTYYLSQIAAGQLADSPCVDAGDSPVGDLELIAGPDLTTRTDQVPDANTVDMGYHYKAGAVGSANKYQLAIEVYEFDPNEGGHGRLNAKSTPQNDIQFDINDPDTIQVSQGTVVNLTAFNIDPGYRVQYWSGTDNDSSIAVNNTVTMNSNKKVIVAFEPNGLYYLTVTVIGNGTVVPNGRTLHSPGEVVTLTALPSNPSDAIIWTGTDDDSSATKTNTVTMNGHRNVTVEFYTPRILYVGADSNYPTIQLAIDDANPRDIVIVTPGTYNIYESSEDNPYLYINKDIRLTSTSPGDPGATTIIGGFVINNVSRNLLIEGFTIRDARYWKDYEYGRVRLGAVDGDITGEQNPFVEYHWATPQGTGIDGYGGGTCRGAGMQLNDAASPTVRNCQFINCVARGWHGATGSGGTGLDLYSGNGGPGGKAFGGGAYCGVNGSPLFDNCSFTNCSAQAGDAGNGGSAAPAVGGHGGAWGDNEAFWWDEWKQLYGDIHPLEEYWKYSGYGGAIYCDVNSTAEFRDCTFTGNTTIGGSCGISGAVIRSGWPSQHYKIESFGGAVYVAADSMPKFVGCVFTGNEASMQGPPTSRKDNIATVNAYPNVSFGGAVAFEDGAAPLFEGCTFNGNQATIGGGAFATWAYGTVSNCSFEDNFSYSGGGILYVGGTSEIINSRFTGNQSTASSAQGGAITLLGANSEVRDCNIRNNASAGSGGGIYISSQDAQGSELPGGNSVLIRNCLITGNSAGQNGAGISAVWHSDPNIVNCTIADNVAQGMGGGLYSAYNNYAQVSNSIFWDNTAPRGPQIAVGTTTNPAYVKVTHSDIEGGAADVYLAPLTILEWDVASSNPAYPTNINMDPRFASGPEGSFYLSQGDAGQDINSPCVNAGSADVNDPTINLGGYTTRTDSVADMNTVDLGYHYPPSIIPLGIKQHLTLEVIDGHGTVVVVSPLPQPADGNYLRGTIVTLRADPEPGYRVDQWTNTDNDNASTRENTVTMNEDKIVRVKFSLPRTLTVPGDFTTIQAAVSASRSGDIIIVASGVYNTPGLVIDKEITVTGANPDDPCVVAMTVIDGSGIASVGVIFGSNTTEQTVFDGITIANCSYGVSRPQDSTTAGDDGNNGFPANGSGIIVESHGRPKIMNSVIRNCNITGGDAANGANADATNNAGRGGWAGWARGAGIYVESDASPTFINCTVTNCTVTGGNGGNGGNFADAGGDAGYGGNWSDGTLWETWGYENDYRWYSGYGGGVFCDELSKANFIDCNIINNIARGGMSGIGGNRAAGIQIPMPDTSYRIPSFGGGVYCSVNSDINFVGCVIRGNVAPKPDATYHRDPYLGHGGGIAFEDTASIRLQNCTITDNNSAVGGGVFWAGGAPEMLDCNLMRNTAYIGGGIYATESSGQIKGCTLRNNFAGVSAGDVDVIAGQGGGIFGSSIGAEIADCFLTNNTSSTSGGGIHIYGPADADTIIRNCLLTNNLAGRDGGGISTNWGAVVLVDNCTLFNNQATGTFGVAGNTGFGGGLYCSYTASTEIKNSIFWDNNGLLGTQIAEATGFEGEQLCGDINVSYCDIMGGQTSASVYISPGCPNNWGTGNRNVDPLFVSEVGSGDFHLQHISAGQGADSPCIDAGGESAVSAGMFRYSTSKLGTPDTGIVDLGYHYQVANYCRRWDLFLDNSIDFLDLAVFANTWIINSGYDLEDLKDFTSCWLEPLDKDITPPTPNPMTWAIPPYPLTQSSAGMRANTAIDASGQVFYQFEEVNGPTSAWQADQNYIAAGLNPTGQYCFSVRARDKYGNMTDWSEASCVADIGDVNAPSPAPTILPAVANNTNSRDVNTASEQFQWDPVIWKWDWWQKIVVNVTGVTDNITPATELQVRFICLTDSEFSSDNVIPLAYRPIRIGYPVSIASRIESGGSIQSGGYRLTWNGANQIVYDVSLNTSAANPGLSLNWMVGVYDASGNVVYSAVVMIPPAP